MNDQKHNLKSMIQTNELAVLREKWAEEDRRVERDRKERDLEIWKSRFEESLPLLIEEAVSKGKRSLSLCSVGRAQDVKAVSCRRGLFAISICKKRGIDTFLKVDVNMGGDGGENSLKIDLSVLRQ